MGNKLQEFEDQLSEVENKLQELEELREDLYSRIDEEMKKENNLTLNSDQLHKLLCLLETSIICKDSIKDTKAKDNLLDFRDELSWEIAEMFGYDLNEGSIDAKTYKFHTFKSRW
jgi:regulator of replication initiation timing